MTSRLLAYLACVALALPLPALSQAEGSRIYSLDSKGWQRNTTPRGEVFTCSICEAQVQVQVDVGPPIGPNAPFQTNEQLIASMRTEAQQREFAEGFLKSRVPIPGVVIRVERTGITKIGGQEAVQFMAVVELKPTATRDTTMLLIHKSRLVKISVNYYDGMFTPKAREALSGLFTSFKFL
jgi:hypothetical protein